MYRCLLLIYFSVSSSESASVNIRSFNPIDIDQMDLQQTIDMENSIEIEINLRKQWKILTIIGSRLKRGNTNLRMKHDNW